MPKTTLALPGWSACLWAIIEFEAKKFIHIWPIFSLAGPSSGVRSRCRCCWAATTPRTTSPSSTRRARPLNGMERWACDLNCVCLPVSTGRWVWIYFPFPLPKITSVYSWILLFYFFSGLRWGRHGGGGNMSFQSANTTNISVHYRTTCFWITCYFNNSILKTINIKKIIILIWRIRERSAGAADEGRKRWRAGLRPIFGEPQITNNNIWWASNH